MYFVLVHYYIQNGIFVKSTTQPLVRRLAIYLIQAERYESVFQVCKLNFFFFILLHNAFCKNRGNDRYDP